MTATPAITEQALESAVLQMYNDVASTPDKEYHFWSGRPAAEMFGYRPEWLDAAPPESVDSFAGVGNPHLHGEIAPGQTVVDLGSGAGLDLFIAAQRVGPGGHAIGVDMNDTMLDKARDLAARHGLSHVEFRKGRIEDVPVPDGAADVVISNGVINLSFRKKKVTMEAFRVLRPGGRASLADVVSDAIIPESIRNDPKLWAS
ncbi:MAG: methyltransferase domain-containing protein [Gemmatimonadales bacterium]|nr:methyltransferase domain-containing protein [Gemmatimonadales bacterium]